MPSIASPAGKVSGRAITARGKRDAGAAASPVLVVVAPAAGSGEAAGSVVEATLGAAGVGPSRFAASSATARSGIAMASAAKSEIVMIAKFERVDLVIGVTSSTSGYFVNVANRYLLREILEMIQVRMCAYE